MANASEGQKYELMMVLMPTLTEKELHKEIETVKSLIEARAGQFFHEQVWGKRDLYYTLRGQVKGMYVVLNFTSTGDMTSLKKEMQLMTPILRFLLLKLPANYEVKPFVVLEEEKEKKSAPPARDMREKRKEKPVEEEKKPVKKKEVEVVETPKAEPAPVPVKEEKVEPAEAAPAVESAETEKAAKSKKKEKKEKDFDKGIEDILSNLSDL